MAVGRRDAMQPAFDALLGVADEVFPVEPADAGRAKEILYDSTEISVRDARLRH